MIFFKRLGQENMAIIVKRLGLGLGLGTWDWESRIENRESRIENRNSPSADSKISWATHPPTTHPLTFRGEGDKLQQSAFSKNVSG